MLCGPVRDTLAGLAVHADAAAAPGAVILGCTQGSSPAGSPPARSPHARPHDGHPCRPRAALAHRWRRRVLARLRLTRSPVSVPKPPAARKPSRSARVVGHETVHGRTSKHNPGLNHKLGTRFIILPRPLWGRSARRGWPTPTRVRLPGTGRSAIGQSFMKRVLGTGFINR